MYLVIELGEVVVDTILGGHVGDAGRSSRGLWAGGGLAKEAR